MRMKLSSLALLIALAPCGLAHAQPTLQSQEGITLENQILQLQAQVQQMQSSGGGGGGGSLLGQGSQPSSGGGAAPDPSVITNLLNQVQQLQAQVQQLNGQVDTLQNQVNMQHDQTEKEIGDLKFQLTGGAPAAPGAPGTPAAPGTVADPGQTPPLVPPVAPPTGQTHTELTKPSAPHDQLAAAQAAFAKHDYATAAALAQAVAQKNKGADGYHAQYLYAQALAAGGKPQDAAIAYDDAYNRNRTGAVAPQSLLGLASSLAAINQSEAACDTLSSLDSQFPNPPAGMAPRIAAVRHRAHCA